MLSFITIYHPIKKLLVTILKLNFTNQVFVCNDRTPVY